MSHDTLELDQAAGHFHDYPCYATASRYGNIAIDYFANMIITVEELKSIIRLTQPYIDGPTEIIISEAR
jgi:hypothetical protein